MEIVIDGARRRPLASHLAEYWEYRGLLRHLVVRELKVRYRHTTVGIVWSLAQPLLPALLLSIVFSKALTAPGDAHVPYALFLLAGFAPWSFFGLAVSMASGAFITNGYILTKVYFPRAILPAASVLTSTLEFVGTCLLLCVWAIFAGWPIHLNWLLLPVLFVFDALFAFFITLGIASLNVLYRDVRHALPFVLQVWMYATPVLYSPSLVPAHWRWLLALNPMTAVVLGFRHVLLATPFDLDLAVPSAIAAVIASAAGVAVFLRLQDVLAERV